MPYRVGRSIFDDWTSMEFGRSQFSDTFILHASSSCGLSPWDYANGIKVLLPELLKLHRSGSVWIKVDSPGIWYPMELRNTLWGARVPIAVTRSHVEKLSIADFSTMPWLGYDKSPPPPLNESIMPEIGQNAIDCLRVMARVVFAFTAEVASLAGLGETVARAELKALKALGYVKQIIPAEIANKEDLYSDKFPYWKLSNSGSGAALRSWGIPLGYRFVARREKTRYVGDRHRRASRLWPAWLRRGLSSGEVWHGWSEVYIPELRMSPDGLAIGKVDGKETLFWLEVNSGNQSSLRVAESLRKKFLAGSRYTEDRNMQLVFAVLGREWVLKVASATFSGMKMHTAVIMADWKDFGILPVVQWGRVRIALTP